MEIVFASPSLGPIPALAIQSSGSTGQRDAKLRGPANRIQGFCGFGQADVMVGFSRAPGAAIRHLPGPAELDALIHKYND